MTHLPSTLKREPVHQRVSIDNALFWFTPRPRSNAEENKNQTLRSAAISARDSLLFRFLILTEGPSTVLPPLAASGGPRRNR